MQSSLCESSRRSLALSRVLLAFRRDHVSFQSFQRGNENFSRPTRYQRVAQATLIAPIVRLIAAIEPSSRQPVAQLARKRRWKRRNRTNVTLSPWKAPRQFDFHSVKIIELTSDVSLRGEKKKFVARHRDKKHLSYSLSFCLFAVFHS